MIIIILATLHLFYFQIFKLLLKHVFALKEDNNYYSGSAGVIARLLWSIRDGIWHQNFNEYLHWHIKSPIIQIIGIDIIIIVVTIMQTKKIAESVIMHGPDKARPTKFPVYRHRPHGFSDLKIFQISDRLCLLFR